MTVWTTLTLTVVTPLFSGDDSTGGDPIRVPSIRGALRFWFRAVAAGHGVTDLQQLWAQERDVFGSTDKPSPIALRVRQVPSPNRERRPLWATGTGTAGAPEIAYLLGLGLWKPGDQADCGLQRGFVPPGASFVLDIRFSESEQANCRFMHALWAWLMFGGLGARTRRGFGQLRVDAVTGRPLPGMWEQTHLQPPRTEEHWNTLLGHPGLPDMEEVNDHGWNTPTDPHQHSDTLPEWPTLRPTWWHARLMKGTYANLHNAFRYAGTEWRSFLLTQKAERGVSTPEWKGAITGGDARFPRAVLGLPVTYHRRPEPAKGLTAFDATVQANGGEVRRASPVWIRPVPLGKNDWRVMTHVFWCRLLPKGAVLTADGDAGKELDIPEGAAQKAWEAWIPPTGRPVQRRLPKDYYDQPRP